ncbi:MAG: hypothetical protein R2748_06050 [Bryobacterales bacterium]
MSSRRHLSALTLFALLAAFAGFALAQRTAMTTMLERARSLELDTPYVPPATRSYHAAGFAKVTLLRRLHHRLDPISPPKTSRLLHRPLRGAREARQARHRP